MSSVSSAVRRRASGRHEIERAHVVQPVGELDQQHAHIGRDREQQLAQVLGLLGLARDEVELLQLGQAIDQRADLRPELLVDLGARRLGVLDRVVQQRRHDGRVVELEIGQDRGDFERMGEIGIARGARLRAVRLHGVDIGAVEQVLVGVRIVVLDPLDQVVLPHHVRLAPSSAPRPRPARSAAQARPRAARGAGSADAADRSGRGPCHSLGRRGGSARPVGRRIPREITNPATRLP